jgi:tripartite-type tricarboxylate transporter receptor subunit TctC
MHQFRRRTLLERAFEWALAASLGLASAGVAAQAGDAAYPVRPLRWVVPYSAGSFSDTLCRTLATDMAAQLGQPLVIENLPGAGGAIGTERARTAAPDGYTIVYAGSSAFAINVSLMKLNYDPLKDFRYVSLIGYTNYVLAAYPGAPFGDLAGLVASAKANPGSLSFASPGNGTGSHLAMELFEKAAGIRLQHVPYKGSAPGVSDLVAGHVPLMLDPLSTLGPHIRAGRLRALAVTGTRRMRELPEVPTFAELGIEGLDAPLGWFGLVVPAGTPDAIVATLHAALGVALQRQAARLGELGVTPDFGSPEAFRSLVQHQIPRYRQLVQETGMKLD